MKKVSFVLNIFILLCLPYVSAWGFNHWMAYRNDVLMWDESVSGVLLAVMGAAVMVAFMAVFILYVELSFRTAGKVKHGLAAVTAVYAVYPLIWLISLLLPENKILTYIAWLICQRSAFLYMFALSCIFSIYNIVKFGRKSRKR